MKYLILVILCFSIVGCNNNAAKHAVIIAKKDSNSASVKNILNTPLTWYDSLIVNYIQKTDDEIITAVRHDTSLSIQWVLDRRDTTATANYLIFHLGHDVSEEDGSDPRFVTDAWIYIDSITKNIYHYDVGKDSLTLVNFIKGAPVVSISAGNDKTAMDTSNYQYCNPRFDFCFEYPQNFIVQAEPENGDGRSFVSPDGRAEIAGWGRLCVDDDLKKEFEIDISDIKVNYKLIKNNWFVISGTDKNGKIVYQKTIQKKMAYMGDKTPDTDVFLSLRITYPADQEEDYKAYCRSIAKSFQ